MHKFFPLKAVTTKVAYNTEIYTPKDRTCSITHIHLSPKLSYASTHFKNGLHSKKHCKTLIAIEGDNTKVFITCLLTYTVQYSIVLILLQMKKKTQNNQY